MASKKQIRIRVAPSGATIGITMPSSRMDELLSSLPQGELRDLIVKARDEANGRMDLIRRDKLLTEGFTPESGALFGWSALTPGNDVAFAAMRQGDFRLVTIGGRTGWECGPVGAFDRDASGATILRGAVQLGVFSDRQAAYRMLVPTQDASDIQEKAETLVAEWTATTAKMPKARYDEGDPHRVKAMAKLPQGARPIGVRPPTGYAALQFAHSQDELVAGERHAERVSIYPCHAVLRITRRFDPSCNQAFVVGTHWAVGRRDVEPDRHRMGPPAPLDGPYDFVMGDVWAVWGQTSRSSMPLGADITETVEAHDREEALEQAREMAARLGIALRGLAPAVAA